VGFVAGPREAASARDAPEVLQMLIVNHSEKPI
jgi:hypothetical protein